MPKKEINDYIFYKIVCLDIIVELCYVGSTANWKARNHHHKYTCNNENYKNYNLNIYKTIRANGGWENFKMVQIGTREQLTKREAEQIEEEHRQELKANMNMRRCYLTEEQKHENRKKLLEYQKEYRVENRKKLLKYQKEYRVENRKKLLKYQEEYRVENKDKKNEKVICICGCNVIKRNLLRHQTTEKHINLINR